MSQILNILALSGLMMIDVVRIDAPKDVNEIAVRLLQACGDMRSLVPHRFAAELDCRIRVSLPASCDAREDAGADSPEPNGRRYL